MWGKKLEGDEATVEKLGPTQVHVIPVYKTASDVIIIILKW